MSGVKQVIFDIGNVLITWDPRLLYRQLISDTDELERFLADVVTLDWHSEHDRGRPFAEGVALLSDKYPEYGDLIQAFDTRWDDTLGPVHSDTVAIIEQLVERGIRCFALTNFSAEKYPGFARKYGFVDLFDGVVVSGEVGLVKPDPRIFSLTLDRFKLDAEETAFIDDRPVNVAAAKLLGMHGHVYDGAPGTRRFLANLGLL